MADHIQDTEQQEIISEEYSSNIDVDIQDDAATESIDNIMGIESDSEDSLDVEDVGV